MEQFVADLSGAAQWVLSMGIIFGLVALCTKRRRIVAAAVRTWPEFRTNLGLAIVNLVMLAPLFAMSTGSLNAMVGSHPALIEFWAQAPALPVFLVVFLVDDLVVYWRHRLEHHPLLWRFHATHHADTHYHWLTVLRKHPVSALLSRSLDMLLLLLLGFPAWAIAISGLLSGVWGFFIHADVPWTLGRAGRWLISPAAHRLHHIRDEAHMGANFGNTLIVWDRMFGTYVDPTPHATCETGIAEGTRGLFGELVRPWERRYRLRLPMSGKFPLLRRAIPPA